MTTAPNPLEHSEKHLIGRLFSSPMNQHIVTGITLNAIGSWQARASAGRQSLRARQT